MRKRCKRQRVLMVKQGLALAVLSLFILGLFSLIFIKIHLYVNADGLILPDTNELIRAPISSFVQKVYVTNGELVKAGQKIVELDTKSLQLEEDKIAAEISENMADVEILRDKLSRTKQELQNERYLSKAQVNRDQLYADQAGQELTRGEKLFKVGAISEQELDNLRNRFHLTNVQLSSSQSEQRFVESQSIQGLEKQLNELETSLATQKRILKLIRENQQKCIVFAQKDGVVYGLPDNIEGRLVSAGDLIANVGNIYQGMMVYCDVIDTEIEKIRLGQDVELYINAYPYSWYFSFKGKIVEIDPQAYYSTTKMTYFFRAKVKLNESMNGLEKWWLFGKEIVLKPNMTVKARIITNYRRLLDVVTKPWGYY